MKKLYKYFLLFFIGSLLPFIIVEFYFQDYFTIGLIATIAFVVLALSVLIEYSLEKSIQKLDRRFKKTDYSYWTQKKESGKAAFFFFRNRLP